MPEADPALGSTLGSRVAAILRQRILSAEPGYEPGSRLLPARIANELGVSITPVREAVQLLAAAHLVDLSPHRSVRVVGIAPHELEDLLRVLAGLQTLAVRFQDGRLSADAVAQLTECLNCCVTAVACDDVASYRVHDHRFHRQLVVASGSAWLTSLYDNLSAQAAILEIYFPHEPESIGVSLAEHWDLLRQLAEGDPAVSESAMEEHCNRSMGRARRVYQRVAARVGIGDTLDGARRGTPGSGFRG